MNMKTQTIVLLSCISLVSVIPQASGFYDEDVGFFGTLRGYVGELGNVMQDVAHGVKKLSKGIKNVEEFLDATIDEDCYFECPGGKNPVPKKDHIPKSNGCGSFGIEEYIKEDLLPLEEFVDCCNAHDICYETCNEDKDDCDLRFKKCLYKKCKNKKDSMSKLMFKGCQAGAKLLYTGTTALGCKPYINAQQESCTCPGSTKKDEL